MDGADGVGAVVGEEVGFEGVGVLASGEELMEGSVQFDLDSNCAKG